jgi:uncharacterized protein YciI
MAVFTVIRSRGTAWNDARPMEQQDNWVGHAAFMNALHVEGFVALGGPLDGTKDTLLVIRADDADQIGFRLAADPWTRSGLLSIRKIAPWSLRLGTID